VIEVGFAAEMPLQYALDDPLGRRVASEIHEFLEGDRRRFDVPIDWTVMPPAYSAILRALYENVSWGDFVTYGELAAMAGYPGAARAAGTACRHNPFAVVVPAHRVIAAGGRIGGFAGRPDLKRALLAREGLGPFKD
jgi:methylated-DNA-[protein]-cysteine S-methyltransferase